METTAPLWAATVLAAVLTAYAAVAAKITSERRALIWAFAFSALSLRLVTAHLELAFGPHWQLTFVARAASPLFAILVAAGASAKVWRSLKNAFIPASILTGAWLAWVTVSGGNPALAVAPAEFFAALACLLAARRKDAPLSWPVSATLYFLAARALARPFLAAAALSPQTALILAASLWALPSLALFAALVSDLKKEADTQRERAETLAEGSGTGVAVVDGAGRCVYANTALAGMLGFTAGEALGAPVEEEAEKAGLRLRKLPLPGGGGYVLFVGDADMGEEAGGKLFELASALGDGAALVDPQSGAVVRANGLWETLFTRPGGESPPDFWEAAPPGEGAAFRDGVLKAAQSGGSFEAEVRGISGRERLRLSVAEVERDGSLLLQVIAQRLSEDTETRARLETSGELAAGLAHDLKNVLQAILSCSDGLALSGSGDGAAVKAISEAAKKGDGLVRRILDGSRGKPDAKRCDLGALVLALAPLAVNSTPSGVVCEFPADALPMPVMAAPEEVEQAVMNLVVNAREAVGTKGRVRLTLRARGGEATVAVEDDGPGVPEELRGKIFLPLVSTKGRAGGLGLSMVRASAERFGGRVEVERSESLGGARFTLTFPLAPPGAVLLVDGDDTARAALDRELKLAGRRVHSTPNGDRALKLLKERGEEITVVVADLVMDGTGGKRFLDSVAAQSPAARIVVVSSITSEAARRGALKAGASVFLRKPASPAAVLEAMGAA